jgi:hypothetical protein
MVIGLAWKACHSQYRDCESYPCNVKLRLASDGFNHFGNLSTNFSTCPVMLVPYNLPHRMCMKNTSIM